MFCHKCGKQLLEASEFCHACGTRTIESPEAAAPNPHYQHAAPSTSQAGGAGLHAEPRPGVALATSPSPAYVAAAPIQQPLALHPGLSTSGVWSIICSIVAVFLVPPLFGAIALFLGYRAKQSGDAAGSTLMVIAAIATVIGMIFGAVVWAQLVQ